MIPCKITNNSSENLEILCKNLVSILTGVYCKITNNSSENLEILCKNLVSILTGVYLKYL